MTRLQLPDEKELTSAQSLVISEVIAGLRGKVPAPMIAWLRNPELARRAQSLGELLRFETSLAPALSELAILVCGRHWTSHHEWTAHRKIALAAGVDAKTIDEIAAGRIPIFNAPEEDAVYHVSATLLATGKIPNELYQQGLSALGETGMVELVGILGYYSLVALTLNAFEIGLPESFAPELDRK
jgi:4-carboxymuconolactone decarboxylase